MCCDKKLGVHHTVKYNICVAARLRPGRSQDPAAAVAGRVAAAAQAPDSGMQRGRGHSAYKYPPAKTKPDPHVTVQEPHEDVKDPTFKMYR